ncbi:MAG: hypothetical protein ACRDRW_02160, partial [Pseudonocardiaceae bacterium]
GGTQDRDDLTHWLTLLGERDEPHLTRDTQGRVTSRGTRRVPVLSATQLANLPKRRVVVFRHGMPPVLGWAPMAWHRRDVKTHTTATRRAARAVLTDALETTRSTNPATGRLTQLRHQIAHWNSLHRPSRTPSPGAVPDSAGHWAVDTHGTTQRLTAHPHTGGSPS